MKTVTASDANRHFSSVLRDVSEGETFTIVSRGKPLATIAPVSQGQDGRVAAKQALVKRLRAQSTTGDRGWTRDELYDR